MLKTNLKKKGDFNINNLVNLIKTCSIKTCSIKNCNRQVWSGRVLCNKHIFEQGMNELEKTISEEKNNVKDNKSSKKNDKK